MIPYFDICAGRLITGVYRRETVSSYIQGSHGAHHVSGPTLSLLRNQFTDQYAFQTSNQRGEF